MSHDDSYKILLSVTTTIIIVGTVENFEKVMTSLQYRRYSKN